MNRTLAPAVAAFIAVLCIGFGISYGLLSLARTSSACVDLAMILCGLTILPLVGGMTIIVGILLARHLLKQSNVFHPLAIPILATINSLVFCYTLASLLQDIMIACLVFGLILAVSFIFFNWYLNQVSGRFDSKILRCIAGFGVAAILGVLLNLFLTR